MERSWLTKLTLVASAAALTFGAVACEVEDTGDPAIDDPAIQDPGVDDPAVDDTGDM